MIAEALIADGVDVRVGVRVDRVVRVDGSTVFVHVDGAPIAATELLVAVGRTPSGRGFGLEELGVEVDRHGAVVVDDTLATSVEGIWAVGDVTGGLQFTHVAGRMGWIAASNALSKLAKVRAFRFDATNVPWATFTTPEVGRVGLTESEAAVEHPRARVAAPAARARRSCRRHRSRARLRQADRGAQAWDRPPRRWSARGRHDRRSNWRRPRPRSGAGDADEHVRRAPGPDDSRLSDVVDGGAAGGAAVLRPVRRTPSPAGRRSGRRLSTAPSTGGASAIAAT